MKRRSFVVIGDIHGCARSLHAMLKKLSHYKERIVVFIGDYIDRGPDSKGVIEQLIAYSQEQHCIFIRGNHEKMLLDALINGDEYLWLYNGGRTTLDSYGISTVYDLPEDHIEFIQTTHLLYETEDYVFLHAGLKPERPVSDQLEDNRLEDTVLWERSHINAPVVWEKTVIFGHTPVPEPVVENYKIGIDTGCVYNIPGLGVLTSVLLPEIKFLQQNCLD